MQNGYHCKLLRGSGKIRAFEPELHSEIEKIFITADMPTDWTYPDIQPKLMEEAEKRGF